MLYFKIIFGPLKDKTGRTEWLGDGFCDDINNNEDCGFDYGDCCGSNVKKHFCMNCTCFGKHLFHIINTEYRGSPLMRILGLEKSVLCQIRLSGTVGVPY
jgi:hypothetical protein